MVDDDANEVRDGVCPPLGNVVAIDIDIEADAVVPIGPWCGMNDVQTWLQSAVLLTRRTSAEGRCARSKPPPRGVKQARVGVSGLQVTTSLHYY